MRNQKADILTYMIRYGGITQIEATTMLGCTRLAARIKELREDGHYIRSVWKTGKTRSGRKTNYVEYKLYDPRDVPVTE